MRDLVLVTCKQMQVELPKHIDRIQALGVEVRAPELGVRQQFTAAELIERGEGSRLVGIIAGDDELDRSFIEGSPRLRVLVRWGIGMDSVDHAAAAEQKVVVRNTPGVFNDEVADAGLAYVLALSRGVTRVDATVRGGGWLKFEGVTLAGATVGVIGLGGIGRSIARRLQAFGCRVTGFDPFVREPPAAVELTSLDELLAVSRFVVLACPLTTDTYHLVDESRLRSMASDAYLVNVARGPVVDERALERVLLSGHLAGAALDVYEEEPLPSSSSLRGLENVILGAHNGSNTREGVARASQTAADILIEELVK